ncbi:MAG: sigma-70 family RNA polymerase sigma factor [Candidatus Spechtbacteria bacterium]|nr:sigma-70 family RNA polymerase sigma factor [Candidatus Spechtbacteria bacterium]
MSQINSEYLNKVYDQYVDKIYRFALLKVNSKTAAEDIASEVFTRTLEYFDKNKDVKIANIQAFLFRTASNMITDYYRQKSRGNVPLDYESRELIEKETSLKDRPDSGAFINEQMAHIRDALSKMENEHANIVMWHYIEEMPIHEIADIIQRPEGTVRVMLHRGLKELRKNLS